MDASENKESERILPKPGSTEQTSKSQSFQDILNEIKLSQDKNFVLLKNKFLEHVEPLTKKVETIETDLTAVKATVTELSSLICTIDGLVQDVTAFKAKPTETEELGSVKDTVQELALKFEASKGQLTETDELDFVKDTVQKLTLDLEALKAHSMETNIIGFIEDTVQKRTREFETFKSQQTAIVPSEALTPLPIARSRVEHSLNNSQLEQPEVINDTHVSDSTSCDPNIVQAMQFTDPNLRHLRSGVGYQKLVSLKDQKLVLNMPNTEQAFGIQSHFSDRRPRSCSEFTKSHSRNQDHNRVFPEDEFSDEDEFFLSDAEYTARESRKRSFEFTMNPTFLPKFNPMRETIGYFLKGRLHIFVQSNGLDNIKLIEPWLHHTVPSISAIELQAASDNAQIGLSSSNIDVYLVRVARGLHGTSEPIQSVALHKLSDESIEAFAGRLYIEFNTVPMQEIDEPIIEKTLVGRVINHLACNCSSVVKIQVAQSKRYLNLGPIDTVTKLNAIAKSVDQILGRNPSSPY